MTSFIRPIITLSSFIFAWFAIIEITGVPFYILPSPVDVTRSLLANYDTLTFHSIVTLTEIIAGLMFGITFGSLAALVISMSQVMRFWLLPILVITQTLPVFAIAPILVLWLGYDMTSKIVMATLIIFFPVTVALLDGLKNTKQEYLDLAKTMDATPIAILQFLNIPNALPSFASGVRVASSVAPIGAIVGEWVGSSKGLGFLMLHANGRMETDLMFAALFILSVLAISIYFAMSGIMNLILLRYSMIKTP